jgi:hypothetical protein
MGSRRAVRIEGGHVLVVRLWLEPDGLETSERSWRGQVSCRNRRRHFVGLEMLFKEIREMLDELPEGGSHRDESEGDEE